MSDVAHPLRWHGSEIHGFKMPLSEVADLLPTFDRLSFQVADARPTPRSSAGIAGPLTAPHDALDAIVRQPGLGFAAPVPVGVVSTHYRLLQHTTLVANVREAIAGLDQLGGDLTCDLSLSHYGERMALLLELPEAFDLDPGDGEPLKLNVALYNSVDGSTQLRILLIWIRFICSNGMVLGTELSEYAKRHTPALRVDALREHLNRQLEHAEHDAARLTRWTRRYVGHALLREWIDGPLVARWGVTAAARAWHILTTGEDAKLVPFTPKAPATRKPVRSLGPVPGVFAPPVSDLYGISQVLAWIASRRHDVDEILEHQLQVPAMMHALEGLANARPPEAAAIGF